MSSMKMIPPTKSQSAYHEVPLRFLEGFSKIIAFVICANLLLASCLIALGAFGDLLEQRYSVAIQDGLFVLILLEMFYVTRSFIRFGSINLSLIVNVGAIAAIKEMVFKLDSITLQGAIAFGVLFITLGLLYFMEQYYYAKVVKED